MATLEIYDSKKEALQLLSSVRAFGRTREEALSNLDMKMLREYPDEVYSRSMAKVYDYRNEKSEDRYVAEYNLW